MSRYEDRQELANKIDYEGGLFNMLIGYGLSEQDLPPGDEELLSVFKRLLPVAEMFEMLIDEFGALLPEPGEDWDE